MVRAGKVLILGGTAQGRELAEVLVSAGYEVVSSLAGRTRNPASLAGEVRVGGFGGVDGLAGWLGQNEVAAIVDAVHPFAAQMATNAAAAASRVGVPIIRLSRPSWASRPDAKTWAWVTSPEAAAAKAVELGSVVLLTVGRQSLSRYHALSEANVTVIARVADASELVAPARWQIIEERGPFDLASERANLLQLGVDVVVAKDSGGSQAEAKLDACAELGISVVMIERPSLPSGLEQVDEIADAKAWVERVVQ